MARLHQREQTHCKRGHEFTAENTLLVERPNRNYTERICRSCHRLRDKAAPRIRIGRKNDPIRQAWLDIKKQGTPNDVLEALKDCVALLDRRNREFDPTVPSGDIRRQVIERADTAIAKAEGRDA